jgi:SMI1-KNR4 cell-wall
MKLSMEVINPNPYGRLNTERLKKFEHDLGVQLPKDYRNFLTEFNGGKFLKKFFHISDDEGDSLIHHVYGLHGGPDYLQLDLNHNSLGDDRMPDGILSIADDPLGNQICVGLSGVNRGRIFFFNHDTCVMHLLSSSFKDFVASLVKSNENENEIDKLLNSDDVSKIIKLIESGYDVESTDDHDRTLIERASIKAKPKVIEFLAQTGVQFRHSLDLAKLNAEYFEKHKPIVELLLKLQHERK